MDDVVSVDQRARHRFTDPINIDRRSSNEGDDTDTSPGEEHWNQDDAKPSNVNSDLARIGAQ